MNRLASDQAQLYEFVAPRAGKAGEKNSRLALSRNEK